MQRMIFFFFYYLTLSVNVNGLQQQNKAKQEYKMKEVTHKNKKEKEKKNSDKFLTDNQKKASKNMIRKKRGKGLRNDKLLQSKYIIWSFIYTQ